jgi:integrase/recombinase XerD
MKVFKAIAVYIERKRAGGLFYRQTADILYSFSRQTGNVQLAYITKGRICDFLSGGRKPTVDNWVRKYQTLSAFFKYWKRRGQIDVLRMPPPRRGGPRRFTPFIYTQAELRQILKATGPSQRGRCPSSVDAFTFSTVIKFLYGTGVLIEEMLNLRRGDVDLEENMITLRRPNIGTSRRIPIGPQVQKLLRRYLNSSIQRRSNEDRFFLNGRGEAVEYLVLSRDFRRLRRYAKVTRLDAGHRQPRFCDLRFTFIVHRLTSWFEAGVNVERMLPPLAEFLGETDLRSVHKYLALTPAHFHNQLHFLNLLTPSLNGLGGSDPL